MLTWRLLNRLSSQEDCRVFEAMYDLYVSAFPEDSERESKETWEQALALGDDGPYRLEFVVCEAGKNVAGGVALEYYPKSACGLLTFLFVSEAHRQKGVARALVERACARLDEASRGRLRYIFAEAEDPVRVQSFGIKTSMDPVLRLRALSRLGARAVQIDYVQPALGPEKRPAEHLILLLLAPARAERVDRPILRAFLLEFYGSLGVHGSAADALLIRAMGDDDDLTQIPLREIDRLENGG